MAVTFPFFSKDSDDEDDLQRLAKVESSKKTTPGLDTQTKDIILWASIIFLWLRELWLSSVNVQVRIGLILRTKQQIENH